MAGLLTAPTRGATLADGRRVFLRPVRADDAAEVLAFFERVSSDTLRLRFFSWRRVELADARAMAEVDHDHSEAVVACLSPEVGARIVGLASYDRTGPGAAEVAFTVEDGYQGQGLGRQLLAWIIAAAETRGFTQLRGEALSENGRMLRLVCQSGYPWRLRHDAGSCAFSLAIGPAAELTAAA
jgi:GNAT superfamily N-acetyltransferase